MLNWGWKPCACDAFRAAVLLALLWSCKGGEGPRDEISAAGPGDHGILRNKNIWLITISYCLVNYVFYVFVFWFFPYLVQVRHFDMLQSSWIATAPWILAICYASGRCHLGLVGEANQ